MQFFSRRQLLKLGLGTAAITAVQVPEIVQAAKGETAKKERILCTSAPTLYVDSAQGDDKNAGTKASAWKTIQHACNYVANTLDMQGFGAVIQLAPGTYNEQVTLPAMYVNGTVQLNDNMPTILGAVANPQDYVIDGGKGVAVFGTQCMPWKLKGVKIQAPGTGGIAVEADIAAYIYLEGVDFGPAMFHCQSLYDSLIKFLDAGYSISADAATHWFTAMGGKIKGPTGYTITLKNSPHFSNAFAVAITNGMIYCLNVSVKGKATGLQYNINRGGGIDTEATFTFPGSVPGTVVAPGWLS